MLCRVFVIPLAIDKVVGGQSEKLLLVGAVFQVGSG